MRQPIQPLYKDEHGLVRFKENKIVRQLLDFASSRGMSLNDIAMRDYSQEDRVQFAQLIGYSLSGFGTLSYVDNDTYEAAALMKYDVLDEKDARIQALTEKLDGVRETMRELVPQLFNIHPDDLTE